MCPLCLSANAEVLERVDGESLNREWQRQFGLRPVKAQLLRYLRCHRCTLRFFDPLECGGPDLYQALEKHDWYYMREKPEFDLALPYLADCIRVLEIGAGDGAFGAITGGTYVGLDTNPSAVERGRDAGLDLRNQTLDIHLRDAGDYDVVVAFQVLEHLSDPRTFLETCVGALRPGGRLVIAVPDSGGFVGAAVNNLLNMPPHHVTHWSSETFEKAATLIRATLVEIVIEPLAPYHERWAAEVFWETRLRSLARLQPSVLDRRPPARFASRLARPLARHIRRPVDRSSGHSLLAVFER
jgi:SAM-dependent methyltransferase